MLLRLYRGDDLAAGVGQFLHLGVAAEAEADRRARLAVIEAECAQYVARPARAAGASGAQRKSDPAQVGEQARGIHTVAADVEIPLVAALNTAVDRPARAERLHRRGPEMLNMIIVAVCALGGELGGGAEPDAQRRRQRARAHPPLLAAAVDEWSRLGAVTHPQCADAFGPVDLVGGQRHKVRSLLERQPPERLHRVTH